MKKFQLLLMLSLISFGAMGQVQLDLPDDPELADEAKRRFAISVDEMTLKRYPEAVNAIQWLEKNTPKLYDGFYINGYKAYEELAKAASDDAQKNLYLDSMFYFYAKKGERYELTDREKNNVAYRYYKYWKSNKQKIGDGMKAYEVSYENKGAVINNNVVSYMDMVRRFRAYGNSFSNEQVLEVYGQIMEVIDIKRANGGDAAKLDKYVATVNGLLTQIIGDDLNCDFINDNLAPPLDEGDDLNLAKKVFGLLLGQGCSDSPYFLKSALMIHESEPTSGLAKAIAQQYYKREDMDNAAAYYTEAINLESNQEKKGDLYFDIAKLYVAQGNKSEARKYAMNASELNSDVAKEAFSFIGDLYMGSFDDCKKSVSQIDDRAVFMAAYDMYQRAGNQAGMRNAKAQFPTISDVFTANKKEGDKIKVGCWVNVTTTIKTRPSE